MPVKTMKRVAGAASKLGKRVASAKTGAAKAGAMKASGKTAELKNQYYDMANKAFRK
jgi:hypothetical protein